MSVNNNVNAASTYQTVVIAIVAGGILSTGIMSILWKRRQARRWIAMRRNMPAGANGARGGMSGSGDGGKGVGKPPGIWDVVFGGEDDKRAEMEGGEGKSARDGLDLEGKMRTGWSVRKSSTFTNIRRARGVEEIVYRACDICSPLLCLFQLHHLHLSSLNTPQILRHPYPTAEITVLIAMPQPDPNPNSAAGPSSLRVTTVTQPFPDSESLQANSPPEYSSVYHYPTYTSAVSEFDDEDGRPLPLLEMGFTSIPVSPSASSRVQFGNSGLEEMFKKAATEREESSGRRHRSRSTAWDGVAPNSQPQAINGGFQGTGIDPLTSPSTASRYAMIRNGALAGFGSPSAQRGLPAGSRV